jgi:hypothetical protein
MQAARAEIAVIQSDPELRNKYISGDVVVRERMAALHRTAYPAPGVGVAQIAPPERSGAQGALDPSAGPTPAQAPQDAPTESVEPAGEAPEYKVTDYYLPHPAGIPERQAIKQAAAIGDMLGRAGIEPAIGNELWRRGVAMYQQNGGSPPDEAAAALSMAQAKADLLARHGADARKILDDARSVVRAAAKRNPGLVRYLEQTGLGSDPWTIESLARHARKNRSA